MKKFNSIILVFISAMIYGSYGVWSVLIGKGFDTFFVGYVRSLVSLLFLLPITYLYFGWTKFEEKDYKFLFWPAFFALFIPGPMYYSFQNSSIGVASLIFFASYLVSQYIFGYLFLKEKIQGVKLFSLGLVFIGLFFVFKNSWEIFTFLALFAGLISGIASGAQVASTKLIPKKYNPFQLSVFTWTVTFISCFIFSILLGERQIMPTLSIEWLYIIVFGLMGCTAFLIAIYAYKRVEASVGGLVGLSEIIFAVFFGWLFFNEQVTANILIGSVLILVAATLPILYEK